MVEPGEDWFEYPDGVPELTNDGIDCCPRCQAVENGSGRTFGPYPFSIHGHAPVSGTQGRTRHRLLPLRLLRPSLVVPVVVPGGLVTATLAPPTHPFPPCPRCGGPWTARRFDGALVCIECRWNDQPPVLGGKRGTP